MSVLTSYKTASGNLAFHEVNFSELGSDDCYKTASGNLAFHLQMKTMIWCIASMVTKPQAVIWPFTRIKRALRDEKTKSYKTASGNLAFHPHEDVREVIFRIELQNRKR